MNALGITLVVIASIAAVLTTGAVLCCVRVGALADRKQNEDEK